MIIHSRKRYEDRKKHKTKKKLGTNIHQNFLNQKNNQTEEDQDIDMIDETNQN